MANKGNLKSFARYDGNGRLIPGSNILRKDKPGVGNWVQLTAYECCETFTYPNISVCSAGTVGVNGEYTHAGARNGKPYYTKGTYVISWGEYPEINDWEIYDSEIAGTWYYYSDNDVLTPDLVTEWVPDDGDVLAPVVGINVCPE